jgi:hypothetical protein
MTEEDINPKFGHMIVDLQNSDGRQRGVVIARISAGVRRIRRGAYPQHLPSCIKPAGEDARIASKA